MYGSPDNLIGTVLSDTYEIERVVGEGTYGTVYAATHKRLHKPVAVKVLRAHDSDAFARFRREAEIAGNLGSRFIAQVFDFNTMDDGSPYLVMELLEGEDLASRLKRQGRLKLADALKVCEQASMALSVAHRHQIVHRDLKPQNIFLCRTEDEGEVVKVIDFGISKVLSKVGTTAAGQFIGTPLYMSPEQVRGQTDKIDERSDIYGLAAVMYEALAGRPCYSGRSIFELVDQINGPAMPPPLSAQSSEIPQAVDDVLQQALAKNREDRPTSVTSFYNQLANAIRASVKSEAQTPAAAIMGTHALETAYATGMVATPLWRGRTGSRDDELRFVAPDDGFFGGDNRNRTLKLTRDKTEFGIGSVPMFEQIKNDLVLPHRKVSRNACRVIVRDGRPHLRREPRCSVPVRVGLSILERGEERPLHHGQALAIGVVAGVFHDGRYVPTQVPAQAVDEQTGLLGREGLAWEVALAARLGDGRRLLIGMPIGGAAGDQAAACQTAAALHALDPSLPVARFRQFVAALYKPEHDVGALAATIAGAGAPMLVGHHDVGSSSDEAGARIDEAIGALDRLAASGAGQELIDLDQHQLSLFELAAFQERGRQLMEAGGEIGLLALEDQEQLRQLGDAVFSALELELLQVVGRAAGGRAILCRPAAGAVAFAGPDAAEPIARQIASEWHSRGPVRGEVLEVERSVAIDVVHLDELADLKHHARHLATGQGLGAGVEGLPLPLASAAQQALNATQPVEKARALIGAVDTTWRLLSIALGAMALAARKPPEDAVVDTDDFGEPWRGRALAASVALADVPGRVGDLARSIFDNGQPRRALQVADDLARQMNDAVTASPTASTIARELPVLADAVGDLLIMLRPLRGWTLASVVRVDRVDVFGDCETVHYVDYTGTYQQGTMRQVTLIKDLRMGPFVYLTRFAEGIVVPLEPMMRRRTSAETGTDELYWAAAPIAAPGVHRYHSVIHGYPLDDDVNEKQIPRAMRR